MDLNNSDGTEGQSLNTEGVNLVPNNQVSIRVYKERYKEHKCRKNDVSTVVTTQKHSIIH